MTTMTFGRQANLGRFLLKKRDGAIQNLNLSKQYYTAVEPHLPTKEMRAFHDSTFLTGLYSVVDGYLTDLADEALLCFPDKLRNSDIKLKDALVGAPSLIAEAVEKQVESLGYRNFAEMVEGVAKMFTNATFAHRSLDCVRELKATRDIYVHNDGVVNAMYLRKAGSEIRQSRLGERLPLGADYLMSRTDDAIAFINAFHAHGPQSMEHFGRAQAFEQMWKATYLHRLVPFDDAWHVENDDLIRPKDRVLQWAWSGSEKYLFDFFLSIYNPDHPDIKSKLADAFYRWPATSTAGRVMVSWLENPFWF